MQPSTQTTQRPAVKNIVHALREEANQNPVFNSVCLVFSMRERTRQQITLPSLMQTMDKEKFSFTRAQLEGVLRFLSTLGIGSLAFDKSGKIFALKNIKITLQSIGLVSLSKKDGLDKFKAQPHFESLVADTAAKAPKSLKVERTPAGPVDVVDGRYPATLTIKINGSPVVFELPRGITLKELSIVLTQMYGTV